MELKKEAAKKAVELIKENTSVGIGAGTTMIHIAKLVAAKIQAGFVVDLYTPSKEILEVLNAEKISVNEISGKAVIDQYFDGCDQVDRELNAIKSGGGIHTIEKLFASMAKEFVIVGDESKYVEVLNNKFPIVIEVLPEALHFVTGGIQRIFEESTLELRTKNEITTLTEHGNYLVDIWFKNMPPLHTINSILKSIAGVVETSFFYHLADKAVLAGPDGIRLIKQYDL
ncbi:MAG: ribose 5-phosphate isomerase A [Bacteroidota bacterium]